MGQKVNPVGFRLAVTKDWRSKWFATKQEFPANLQSDHRIRAYLKQNLAFAALSKILIERAWNSVRVTLFTARPGLVIGKKGAEIERMNTDLSALSGGKQVKIDIYEIKQPELDAQLIAENIALQLERRIAFRRAMKRAVQTAMDFGAEGIKVRCGGRLAGADIARSERYHEGKVPLQTLRVNIDYGFAEARTVYGIIGVKVWLTKKEDDGNVQKRESRDSRPPRRERGDRGDRGDRGGDRRDRAESPSPDREAAPTPAPAPAAPTA